MNSPYVFISYAHADSEAVLSIIDAMQKSGINLWYDNGIEAGSEWPEYIAQKVNSCTKFVSFISKAYLASQNCKRELNFAISKKKELLSVYLEDVELSLGMEMQLGTYQAIFRNRFSSKEEFILSLCNERFLSDCINLENDDNIKDQPILDVSTNNKFIFSEDSVTKKFEIKNFAFDDELTQNEILIIKNNSDYKVNIELNVEFCDANGVRLYEDPLPMKSDAVNRGSQTLFWCVPEMDCPYEYAYIKYVLSVKEETDYKYMLSDLSYTYETDDDLCININNNSNEKIEYANCHILYFLNDEPIFHENITLSDGIAPKTTITEHIDYFCDFDYIECYFSV